MPRRPTNILEVRISSPRLAWLGFVGFVWGAFKICWVIALVAALGLAGQWAYKQVVLDNPDFQLRVIDLNPNDVLDERGFVKLTGLELTSNITRIDVAGMYETLAAQPAIVDARIERHWPDTLVIRLTTREPRAWISSSQSATRKPGALLIDANSVPYPCPDLQFEAAAQLPAIHLREDAGHPIVPGQPLRHPHLRPCMRLLERTQTDTPDLLARIDTLERLNAWSIRATTRCGVDATFGLREHPRQLTRLRAALNHLDQKNESLATINLIPRDNVPITLKTTTRTPTPDPPENPEPTQETEAPPRAIIVEEPPDPETLRQLRRAADLESLINRR